MTELTLETETRPAAAEPIPSGRRAPRLLAGLLLLGGLAGATQVERIKQLWSPGEATPPAQHAAPSARVVNTVRATLTQEDSDVLLPAQLMPYEQTTLHSRIDGYIKKWHIDRGTPVKQGQLLAEIDAPEIDQQVAQAQASLEQGRAMLVQLRADLDQASAELDHARAQIRVAEANRDYAEREVNRTAGLLRTGAVGRTDHDANVRNRDVMDASLLSTKADLIAKEKSIASRSAAIQTQQATIRGLEANLQRLKEMQKFKFITAPFDGFVTRRYAETGMLVQTMNSPVLYHMQDSSRLRIQVDVPQVYAQQARRAKTGEVIVPEIPDRTFTAQVMRTGTAINMGTRTLAVELELPNADRAVLAGSYAQVRLRLPAGSKSVQIPSHAVRYTPQGVEVVVVQGGQLLVKPVKLGRNQGKVIEVLTGLEGTEELVANPSDELKSGEAVQVAAR